MDEYKAHDIGEPKHRELPQAESVKTFPIKHPTPEEFNQQVQMSLINKAYAIFGWTLFFIMLVFAIGFFTPNGDYGLVNEMIRILSSIITFTLGFLFATTKK